MDICNTVIEISYLNMNTYVHSRFCVLLVYIFISLHFFVIWLFMVLSNFHRVLIDLSYHLRLSVICFVAMWYLLAFSVMIFSCPVVSPPSLINVFD